MNLPDTSRRQLLAAVASGAALASLAVPTLVRTQAVKLRVGDWPVARAAVLRPGREGQLQGGRHRGRAAPPYLPDVPVRPFEPGRAGTHVTICGLTKYFAGWTPCEDFDLDIPKHRIVLAFGLNGCGKSTSIT